MVLMPKKDFFGGDGNNSLEFKIKFFDIFRWILWYLKHTDIGLIQISYVV